MANSQHSGESAGRGARRRSGLRGSVEIAAFVLGWLLVVEVVLRMFFVSPAQIVHDDALDWRYAPDSTFLLPDADSGYRRVSTNSYGLNNDRLGPKGSRKRILVLGDSYVEAVQLPRRASFLGVLRNDNTAYDFVNMGRSGLDPLNEEAFFEELAPKLEADGAILVVNFGDQYDILNADLRIVRCGPDRAPCDFVLPHESRSRNRELVNLLESHSALATFLARKYQAIFQAPRIDLIDRLSRLFDRHATKVSQLRAVSRSDLEPLLAIAFGRIAKRNPLLVVYIPTLEYEPDKRTENPFANGWKEIVEGAAKQAGAAFIDTGPSFAAVYARTGQPPVGYDFNRVGLGHPNYAGHAAIAHAIESRLKIFSGGAAAR